MASTVVELFCVVGTTTGYVDVIDGSGVPAASYSITQVSGQLHQITITEAVTGRVAIAAGDTNGTLGFRIVDNLTDTATTFPIEGISVADALVEIHLDHLLAVDYDPSNKPGAATALFNEIMQDDGGGLAQFTANALEQATQGTGPGATEHTVCIQVGGTAVDGAEVWVTTDAAGASVIAGTLSTDADGLVTFMLDPGTYYLWAQRGGVNFTNPTEITVS